MIRLCDKRIFTVEQKELSQEILYNFFKEQTKDALMIVNGGQTEGFITYESIAYYTTEDWSQCIIREYVTAGADMWDNARKFLQRYPKLKYLPIYDQNNELAYFCYESLAGSDSYLYITQILKILLSNPQLLKWNEDFPGIESVEIYDMNEFAFYLAEILIQKGIDVVLHGEKWGLFQKQVDGLQTHMDTEIMRVYAEGTEMFPQRRAECDVTPSFEFLITVMRKEVRTLEMKMQKQWNNFFLCRFPLFGELSYYTNEEEYMTRFVGGADGRELKDNVQKDAFVKVNGLEPEIFYKQIEWEKEHIIDELSEYYGETRVIRSSEGDNTVWLFGPCIVEGYGVLYYDRLCCNIDRYLKKKGVQNYGVCSVSYAFYEINTLQLAIESLPIRKKDVIICIGEDIGWGNLIGEKPDLTLDTLFATRNEERWFYNVPIHTNAKGNEMVSQEICKKLIIPFIQQIQYVKDEYIIMSYQNVLMRGGICLKK